MSDRETPMTDANVASLTKTPDCFCEADFARDLERKLAEVREALQLAAKLPTYQDCAVENHAVVVAAMEALARIDGNREAHPLTVGCGEGSTRQP